MSARETRLKTEFARMLAVRRPGGLIDFLCADLTDEETHAAVAPGMGLEVVRRGLETFITPEQFQVRNPDLGPEKYLVQFSCRGVMKNREGAIVPTEDHKLEIFLGPDFPNQGAPRFVWWTEIFHPNIRGVYLCTEGRPFAVSTTLDTICLMVGQMIQYRNYNTKSYLNKEAAHWAEANPSIFPLDKRNLLTGREDASPLLRFAGNGLIEEVKDSPPPVTGPLVEVV
jgi:hypothetical protein